MSAALACSRNRRGTAAASICTQRRGITLLASVCRYTGRWPTRSARETRRPDGPRERSVGPAIRVHEESRVDSRERYVPPLRGHVSALRADDSVVIILFVRLRQAVVDASPSLRAVLNVIWNSIGGVWAGVLIVLTHLRAVRVQARARRVRDPEFLAHDAGTFVGLLDMGAGATLIREFAGDHDGRSGLALKRDLLRTAWRHSTA